MTELYERWLPVVGFEGYYEVSNHGRVRSLDRLVKHWRGGEQRLKARKMALTRNRSTGYRTVRLTKDGKGKSFKVHKLVATAFLGPCPEGKQVLHGIAGQLNNSVENLRYGTQSENEHDKKRDGTVPDCKGERHPGSKLTEEKVLEIRELLLAGVTHKEIAAQFSIHKAYVSLIKHRTTWAHI